MNGEIGIMDMGSEVSIEVYTGRAVEVRIGSCPIVIMSEEQAHNLCEAFKKAFPVKVSVKTICGYPCVEELK